MKQTLKGIAKPSHYRGAKLSHINLDILNFLISQFPYFTLPKFNRVMFKALYLLMYFACLRIGEAVKSNNIEHTLKIEQFDNLVNNNDYILIKFRYFKHSLFHYSPTIKLMSRNDGYCPVTAIREYVNVRGMAKRPLFIG